MKFFTMKLLLFRSVQNSKNVTLGNTSWSWWWIYGWTSGTSTKMIPSLIFKLIIEFKPKDSW